jgi:MscS family membrane protein
VVAFDRNVWSRSIGTHGRNRRNPQHADHWGDKPPRVFFEDLSTDCLVLVAYVWHHPPDFWAYSAVHDRINLEILRRFGEEGINFAFPTRTTILEPGHKPIAIALNSAD